MVDVKDAAVDAARAEAGGWCSDDDVRRALVAAILHLDTDSLPPFAWRRLSELQTLVAERDAEIARLTVALTNTVSDSFRAYQAIAAERDADIAERDARIKVLEAAAQGLIDGAFGNGSRITVSKTDYDRLVDALSISRIGKPHE